MPSHPSRSAVLTCSARLTLLGLALLPSACDDLPGRSGRTGGSTEDPDDSLLGDSGAPDDEPPHMDGGGPAPGNSDGGSEPEPMDANVPDDPYPPWDAALPPPEKHDYVRVEAEDFLPGPDGYYDTTPENQGAYGRLDEGVDVGVATDTEDPGMSVGYTRPGEWLRYAFSLEKAAVYTLRARVAHETGGGQLSVFVDDRLVTKVDVPGTGGWQSWAWVDHTIGALPAGMHTMKVTIDSAGLNGADAGNLNFFDFVPEQSDGGLPEVDAGAPADAGPSERSDIVRVETEAFLPGPDGYSDSTPQNEGGWGNLAEAVDVGFAGDPETPGSLCIGYTKAGEWLRYALVLGRTADYTLRARVAHESGGGEFSVYVDDQLLTTFSVPSTASWSTWTTIEKPLGRLEAGAHTLKLTVDTGGANGSDAGNVNYLEFVPGPALVSDAGPAGDAGALPTDAGSGDASVLPVDAALPAHPHDGG